MSNYKVGDVAALFPKPKKPATETQKKLQSLFDEFNTLRNKSTKNLENRKKDKQSALIENNKDQNQSSLMKKKKRKFSEIVSSEPDVVNNDKKKQKQTDEQEVVKVIDAEVKKNRSNSDDINFPRKKKGKLNANNLNRNNVDNSNIKKNSSVTNHIIKSDATIAKGNKVSGFIKKSNHKIFSSKKMNEKKSHDSSLVKNVQDITEKQSSTVCNSDDLFKTEEEELTKSSLKRPKKKNKINGLMPISQPEVQNEPDFIKLKSDQEDKEEGLTRTLFVGNLPATTTRKDIGKLFSVFGPIDSIRFQTIETNRNKIFRKGGPKNQNLNYAAESLPGFVVFKERSHAADALSLNGSVFKNHHITVDFAMPPGSKKLYDENRSIFIGNLPFDIKDESVWNAFAECGKIEGVRVVKDRETGVGKGFGYVLFNSIEGRENALALEDVEIQGRTIRIKAVDSNKKNQKKTENAPIRRDSFKSRAIKYKRNHVDSGSRKSVKKIMKKQKELHKKKKIASLMQKSMV